MLPYHPRIGGCLFAAMLAACSGELAPRSQVVLHIDTDVPVPRFGDTLRIDWLDADGMPIERRAFVVPDRAEWPLSVGVLVPAGGEVLLRVRLHPAQRVASHTPALIDATLGPDDPLPAFVIDRLVRLSPPEGVDHFEVVLEGDCLGIRADPVTRRSCVSGVADAPPDAGVVPLERAPAAGASRIGSWAAAQPTPCADAPRPESGVHDEDVCIPGGVYYMGDERLGTNADPGVNWASIPERLVQLSPFYADRYEVTVGRFRAAIAAGLRLPPGLYTGAARVPLLCNFATDGSNDALPMNCITWEGARQFCEWDGRALPTEAQWEYIGSGRRDEKMYPWGDGLPGCEHAVYGRIGSVYGMRIFGFGPEVTLGGFGECQLSGEGPSPVGTVALDRSVDGVMDLAGNEREWVADRLQPYTHECWAGSRLVDPRCDAVDETRPTELALRGGTWAASSGQLASPFRSAADPARAVPGGDVFEGHAFGFRCVRAAGAAP